MAAIGDSLTKSHNPQQLSCTKTVMLLDNFPFLVTFVNNVFFINRCLGFIFFPNKRVFKAFYSLGQRLLHLWAELNQSSTISAIAILSTSHDNNLCSQELDYDQAMLWVLNIGLVVLESVSCAWALIQPFIRKRGKIKLRLYV